MKDINLIYSGGSGGFLLLHLLLLSGSFYVSFKDKTLDQAIEQQWKVHDPTCWKRTEEWPANDQTFTHATELRKIYFHCNPTENTSLADRTAVIYTDYYSQTQLAYYKRAHWYIGTKSDQEQPQLLGYLATLREWKRHYNNIKDPAWPRCVSFRHINKLPDYIQQELSNDPYTKSFIDKQFDFVKYRNDFVYRPAKAYLDSADIVVKLQDVVNTRGEILVDAFDIPPINNQQRELIAHWCSLHPPELLARIGISN